MRWGGDDASRDLSSKTPFLDQAGVLAGHLPDIREQAKNVTSRVPAVDQAADQKNIKKSKTSLLAPIARHPKHILTLSLNTPLPSHTPKS